MKILLEDSIKNRKNELREISSILSRWGIEVSFQKFHFNKDNIKISNLSDWIESELEEKCLFLTKGILKGKKLGVQLKYHGFSNKIGGNLSIVEFKPKILEHLSVICLHEILHLKGLNHCNNQGCVMSLRYDDFKLINPTLCKSCRRELNGKEK